MAQNVGFFNRQLYDNCNYQQTLYESTSPLAYNLYFGKQENCKRCKFGDRLWRKYDLVDIESELRNQTRPLSKCDQFKYSPNCKKSGLCLSTFQKGNPIVPAPEICPIVYNNIPRITTKGYHLPGLNFCKNVKWGSVDDY
jgi:hypothetical protein